MTGWIVASVRRRGMRLSIAETACLKRMLRAGKVGLDTMSLVAHRVARWLVGARDRRAFSPLHIFVGAGLAVLSMVAGPAAGNAQSFYVATNGSDSNPGTLAAPFATFGAAMAAMEASTTKTVTILGGTYSIAGGLVFSPADAGETWIPYQNQTVILDGGGSGYVYTNSANNLTIEGLTFQNLGPGVNVNGGSGLVLAGTSLTIRWNTFLNCNQDCISGSALYSVIDSNTFNGQSPGNPPGQQYIGAYAAIQLYSSPSNNQITHNLIENTQGGGIYMAGDYNRQMANNVIDRNILINVNSSVVDMGAIYMIDTPHTAVGNVITNNIINGYGGSNYQSNVSKAFYLDNHMSNALVSGNIVSGSGTFLIEIHGGNNNSIANNIFDMSTAENQWDGSQIAYQDFETSSEYGMSGNSFNQNIIYFSAGPVPPFLWWTDIPTNAASPNVANNLYYAVSGAAVPSAPDVNPAFANPQFANEPAGNYSMPAGGPAYALINWTTLPTDQGPVANPFQAQQPPPPTCQERQRPFAAASGPRWSCCAAASSRDFRPGGGRGASWRQWTTDRARAGISFSQQRPLLTRARWAAKLLF